MINRNQRVILGMPRTFSIYKVLISRMQQLGFDIIDVSYNNDIFTYRSFWDRSVNFFRKIVLNDKGYKNKLKFKALGQRVLQQLQAMDKKADYAILIRADIYPKDVVERIVDHAHKSIAYQWDGISRYPAVKQLVSLFDHFYVFQGEGFTQQQALYRPLNNFYFGHLYNPEIKPRLNTFYFIGSFVKSRWENIRSAALLIADAGGIVDFYIYSTDKQISTEYTVAGLKFIQQSVDYEEGVTNVLYSEYLVDFLIEGQQGLSIRVFESIGYRRKLITDNASVKNYDFYRPNNIYILNVDERSLSDFMMQPYEGLPEDILAKYNFDCWLHNILIAQ
ncbi:hypothetical protein [Sphingobacterium deserti]|uniref:Uncharacterized protein n=1 Tax=Sphingobacterium deserti TaxID=1229276 RepID=A0A0B8T0L0_9SPHI|nr:hypothetical protein [Sphingobacterium deserti]KGE13916.1 hypothetical protein DI53_2328 [Sphingobacterium deserti]